MFRRLVLAALAILGAGALTVAQAQDQKIKVLGSANIDPAKGTVSFDVSKAAGAYRGIKVRSTSGQIDVTKVQIVYSDGTTHNENRSILLNKGGTGSNPINATSDDRFIDTVTVSFGKGKGKQRIQLEGYQTADGAKKERPAKPESGNIATTPTAPTPSTQKPLVADGNDVLFGFQNVGFVRDRDVIKVGGDIGKFDRVRLRVLGNDVHVNSIVVNYVDGSSQDLVVDADIKANTKSKWIEIQGDKFIRDVNLLYRSKPNSKGQARVEITGQYAEGWLGPNGEGKKYNEGWVLLGAQTAGFTGFDKDTVTVGKNEGGFTKLRVIAKDRAITLREIRVKYFNGPDEVFSMNERIDPGRPYGPLEFKGGKAAIKEIEAKYRSRFDVLKGFKNLFDGNPAVVEIWGQH